MVTPPEIMPEFYFLPFYAIIRAIPHKAFGIIIMIFILLSLTNFLPSFNYYSYLYFNNVRWWSGSNNASGFGSLILSRSLLFVLILDIILSSKLCLMVNHFEAMYWLLLINILCLCSSELIKSSS